MMDELALDGDDNLLNIKQAASLLQVSEVSLRRWTNAGKLPCLRVGARRERRFRRSDLLAYLEQQGAASGATGARGRISRIQLEGISIEHGSHLCSLYQNDLGRLKLSVPFLAGGLRAGDMCFLVAAGDAQRDILHHLGQSFDGLGWAIESGRLVVSDGMADGDELYAFFERSFIMASRAGDRSLRVLGDMAWAVQKGMALDELMAFEARYNRTLAHRFPLVSLCQYDARAFSGVAVHEALICHEDTFNYPLSRFI